MNNSLYGKTMENLRRKKVRLVNNAKDYIQYTNKPSFASQKVFKKDFVAIHEIKPILTLNKPIYVGLSILDLSRLLMYEFHYKYIKSKYNAKLYLQAQAVQLNNEKINEIKTDDVYKDFYEDKNLVEFSNYPQDSKLFDHVNKNVIDEMKDEFEGKIISEFV